jgi:hypothetical protein
MKMISVRWLVGPLLSMAIALAVMLMLQAAAENL